MSQSQPPAQTISSILKGFPGYIFNYGIGLVLAIMSDITLTSLAVGSFFLGYATTPWAGLAIFFLVHTVIKIVNALNGAIVQQARPVAMALNGFAQVFTAQAAAAAKPSLDTAQDTSTGA